MNKNIKSILIAGLACVAFCGTSIAAPHGGRGGNGPRGGSAAHVGRAPASRPAPHRAASAPRPAAHRTAPRPAARHAVSHRQGFRPARHPHPMRHWMRPAMPPPRPYARFGWTWVATPWTILTDGIYCTGDGYWYDGYNYYYNDGYYTSAPVSVSLNLSF